MFKRVLFSANLILISVALPSLNNAQSFSVFDVDATGFPVIKAKFDSFDAEGEQFSGMVRSIQHASCVLE